MKDPLLQETLGFYHKINDIYEKSGYKKSYPLNAFWFDANMKEMLRALNQSESALQAIHAVQKTYMFSVNTPDPIREKAVDWLLDDQRSRGIDILKMDAGLQESSRSCPENNVLRKGRIFTPDFLRTANITCEIKKYCALGARPRVIELGAGCGHLARTFRLFVPQCSYVIVDIPETLSFSYMFLKLNFPDLKIFYVTDERQFQEHPLEDFDYVFIPTKFAQAVLPHDFDLFINTASLGEMKNAVISHWMDFIQTKLKVKNLFTLNRYLNTVKTDGSRDWRLEENRCSVLYGTNWKILNWELEPPYTRCPYVDTVIARYVEIVAEKTAPAPALERRKKARQLVLDVMQEDWLRLEKSSFAEMTYRDNILVNDMTMRGTLFKLWESVRLDANESNVGLILKYLETLLHRQDTEFEETYYYEDLFEALFKSKDNKDLLEIDKIIQQKRLYRKSLPGPQPSFAAALLMPPPFLVEEGYEGYNIVKHGTGYWGILQSLGIIDLSHPSSMDLLQQHRIKGKSFLGSSLFETKYLITLHKNKTMTADIQTRNQEDNAAAKYKAEAKAASEKIGALQAEINARQQEVSSLRQDVGIREKNIDQLKAEAKTAAGKMEALQADIAVREKDAAELKAETEALNRKIRALQTDVALLQTNLVASGQDIARRNQKIDQLSTELSFIKSRWWFKIFNFRNKDR